MHFPRTQTHPALLHCLISPRLVWQPVVFNNPGYVKKSDINNSCCAPLPRRKQTKAEFFCTVAPYLKHFSMSVLVVMLIQRLMFLSKSLTLMERLYNFITSGTPEMHDMFQKESCRPFITLWSIRHEGQRIIKAETEQLSKTGMPEPRELQWLVEKDWRKSTRLTGSPQDLRLARAWNDEAPAERRPRKHGK